MYFTSRMWTVVKTWLRVVRRCGSSGEVGVHGVKHRRLEYGLGLQGALLNTKSQNRCVN